MFPAYRQAALHDISHLCHAATAVSPVLKPWAIASMLLGTGSQLCVTYWAFGNDVWGLYPYPHNLMHGDKQPRPQPLITLLVFGSISAPATLVVETKLHLVSNQRQNTRSLIAGVPALSLSICNHFGICQTFIPLHFCPHRRAAYSPPSKHHDQPSFGFKRTH